MSTPLPSDLDDAQHLLGKVEQDEERPKRRGRPRTNAMGQLTKTERLRLAELDRQIVDYAVEGKTAVEIANLIDRDTSVVERRLNALLLQYSEALAQPVETMGLRSMAQLDMLFRKVLPYATGEYDPQVKAPPDHRYLNVLVALLKEKREWVKLFDAKTSKVQLSPEQQDAQNARLEQTFTSGSDYYRIAQEQLTEAVITYADMDVETLFDVDDNVLKEEIEKRLKDSVDDEEEEDDSFSR